MLEAYNFDSDATPALPVALRGLHAAALSRAEAAPFSPATSPARMHPAVSSYAVPAAIPTLCPDLAQFVERIYSAAASDLARRIAAPLGSLTETQIAQGQDTLREIRFAIAGQQRERLAGLTRKYLAVVPRCLPACIAGQAVLIDTVKKADDEEELLQRTRDVFQVQAALEAGADCKYRALGAQLCPLNRAARDYARIEDKVQAARSQRQAGSLEVKRIFAAHLPDERARFHQEGEPLGNVQELFHGAPVGHLVGILSHGLRVAPRNAPCVEAMFGKGIYFADQSGPSTACCKLYEDRGQSESGYLLLTDVALGRVKRERLACYREQPPNGFDSVQGCRGMYLARNEFIVYHAAQCTLRYIIEVQAQ